MGSPGSWVRDHCTSLVLEAGRLKRFHHKPGVHSSVFALASRIVGPFKANSKSNLLFMETAGTELILNSYA